MAPVRRAARARARPGARRGGGWIAAAALALAVGSAAAQTPRPERVVTVAAISDDFDPGTLDAFTRETGMRLTLDAFPTAQALEAAVASGRYDVATLSAQGLAQALEAGRLARLDPAAIPALTQLDPALARFAPGGAPLLWSAYGLAFDARRARERLGERALDSWEIALRPETLKAFSDCGVALVDDAAAMTAAAALALKIDPQSRRPADLRRALDRLLAARGGVKTFASAAAIGADLAAGDLCLAAMTAGDAAQTAARARAAGEEVEIVFVAPREGAPVAVDALAIFKDAPHPAEAAAFVDFALRSEQVARAAARTRFANAVPAARGQARADAAQEAFAFPDAAATAKLFAPAPMDAATQALVAQEWRRAKTAK